jgi:8-oxo-dGTP pyrophosphatase MutT (NUDIX family)
MLITTSWLFRSRSEERRSETHPTRAFKPDFPGGIVDEGEDFGQAAIREIAEETGLTVDFSQLTPAYAGTNVYEGGMTVHMLYIAQLTTVRPEVAISWEHDQYSWRPLSEVLKNVEEYSGFYRQALRAIQSHSILVHLQK